MALYSQHPWGPELGSEGVKLLRVKEVAWLGWGRREACGERPRVPPLLPCSQVAPHTHAPLCGARCGLTVGPEDQGQALAAAQYC